MAVLSLVVFVTFFTKTGGGLDLACRFADSYPRFIYVVSEFKTSTLIFLL